MPNPNTDFTAGQVLTSSQANRFPRGVMATAVRTAGNVTLGPAQVDITSMSLTFTAVASRLYRATWSVNIQKITSSGWTQIYCTDSANAAQGIALAYTVAGSYANLSGSALLTGLTAGSKTFKLRLECQADTASVIASVGAPCVLIIEDIGPA